MNKINARERRKNNNNTKYEAQIITGENLTKMGLNLICEEILLKKWNMKI